MLNPLEIMSSVSRGSLLASASGQSPSLMRQMAMVWRLPFVAKLVLAGVASVLTVSMPSAEAKQISSLLVVIECSYRLPSAANICPPEYYVSNSWVYVDGKNLSTNSNISGFKYSFDYDPALLAFNPLKTSLVCEFRSASVPAYCPDFPPGQGTTSLVTSTDSFAVDQTGLTITPEASGLPSVTLTYESPGPVTFTGERNFLALAFDLLVPLEQRASVTYSPTLLPAASLRTTNFLCTDGNGAEVDCSSSHPSLSLQIDPVPTPLAAAGLPAMAHARRRIRRRLQQGGGRAQPCRG